MIFTAPLVDIEKNGMHLDPHRAPKLQRDYNAELTTIMSHIDRVTGGANPASPTQMRKVLYEDLKFPLPKNKKFYGKPDKNGNPQPSTGTELIMSLTPKTQKQKVFIELKREFARLNAALTKCLNKFTDCINETADNILTAAMNQAITVTQRLSSSGKNYKAQFQNFPRIFKPLFCARRKGWFIGEIDQAQLEYRVAVFLGQDEAGLQDILDGVDSHKLTAEKVWPEKCRVLDFKSTEFKALRTEAKSRTFKPLYGGQSGTKDEVRYYKWFTEKHKGITKKQAEWKASAVNTGKVTIPSGLTFYFPGTKVLDDGYITNSTNICNYPVQSFATADIVPIGVTYQWHLMRVARLESFLVNTVHDSSIGEVHPDEVEIYTEIGEYAHVDRVYNYLKVVYDVDFNVPLEIEAEYGTHWANTPDWEEKYLT
jgi:DNA polymerase I-like protein with 3'-5' exonuclease and polymerase domains